MTIAFPSPDATPLMWSLAPTPVASMPLPAAPTTAIRPFVSHLEAASSSEHRAEAREDTGRQAAESLVASTFVVPVLAMLRETSRAAEPFAPGDAERRFGPLLDQQLADRIVSGANFGLVDRVYEHLNGPARTTTDASGLVIGKGRNDDA